jgi:hypothetical protein
MVVELPGHRSPAELPLAHETDASQTSTTHQKPGLLMLLASGTHFEELVRPVACSYAELLQQLHHESLEAGEGTRDAHLGVHLWWCAGQEEAAGRELGGGCEGTSANPRCCGGCCGFTCARTYTA